MRYRLRKGRRGMAEALVQQTQQTLDGWVQKLKDALDSKKKEQVELQRLTIKAQEVISVILDLYNAGASYRDIRDVLGKENISHATIARYIKIAKGQKEQPQNAPDKS